MRKLDRPPGLGLCIKSAAFFALLASLAWWYQETRKIWDDLDVTRAYLTSILFGSCAVICLIAAFVRFLDRKKAKGLGAFTPAGANDEAEPLPPPPLWTRFPGIFLFTYGFALCYPLYLEEMPGQILEYFNLVIFVTCIPLTAFAFATVFRPSATGWDKFFCAFNVLWLLLVFFMAWAFIGFSPG
jgi:hypothetical protein